MFQPQLWLTSGRCIIKQILHKFLNQCTNYITKLCKPMCNYIVYWFAKFRNKHYILHRIGTQAVFIMLSDLTESVRGPQHRCTSLLADSKHRGRCHHNPNLTPIMQFLWRDIGISQRCRTSRCSNQGLSQCFPTKAPQNIVRGSLRNGKINKHSWNIAKNFKYPSKYRGNFCPAVQE